MAALLLLALLPYAFDRGSELGLWLPRDGRLSQLISLGLAVFFSLLTLRGALR
jgi:hypothetical protein